MAKQYTKYQINIKLKFSKWRSNFKVKDQSQVIVSIERSCQKEYIYVKYESPSTKPLTNQKL
jgi:fructose-bisphosphate aldolase class 1